MENITRTIYGSFLQSCMLMGLPFAMKNNTTLNEKFGIQADVAPSSIDTPRMRYFAIGNGGHRFTVGGSGIPRPEPIQHRATDAALFNHLPFVLREVESDLTPAERAKYGLRRTEIHQGRNYVAYYLKRVDLTGVAAGMEYKTVADGTTTTTPFVPDSSVLNPTPPDLSPDGVNVVSGDYVTASAKVGLTLTADEVAELINVANVIYDDDNAAIISEIALVSGVDKVVSVSGVGGVKFNFNEVIAAQVTTFINSFMALKFSNNTAELLLDVGATEPLFSLV